MKKMGQEDKQKIIIEKLSNGYLVEIELYDHELDCLVKKSLVVQERDQEIYNNYSTPKENVEAFKEVVMIIENLFGFDCVNEGDYYLDYEVKKKIKNERD